MSSNATTNLSNDSTPIITLQEQSSSFSPHANTTTIPLNVDAVTVVFPNIEEQHSPVAQKKKKSKKKKTFKSAVKKKSSLTCEKIPPKPKKGESKTPLTMGNLYLKDDPFNSLDVDTNVESSVKESKVADVEASKVNPTHSEKAYDATEKAEDFEKGNSEKILKTVDDKIVQILRVDDKKCDDTAGCKIAETMGSKVTDHTNINETVDIPIEKQNVGPDVETSLDQQNVSRDAGKSIDDAEPNDEVHVSIDNDITPTDEDKKTVSMSLEAVDDNDGERTVEQDDKVVDLDDVNSDLNQTIANTYKENSMAKRLRSSSGKVVPAGAKTPITRLKSTVVGPKKRWNKVTPKATTGKKGKKRKAVESSDSEYAHVGKDVSPIPVSITKKSTGKKTSSNVSVVPTDNISFHYPDYAHRWKYMFHRRLALERELGPDVLDINEVVDLIKHAGLEKTVTNQGNCYDKLVKEFLVNVPDECDNPMSQDYHVVYVRGKEVKFSPTIINRFLGIDDSKCIDTELNFNQVCKVITANQVKLWPKKGTIPVVMLSVKYAILNRTGAANWVPTTHSSDIAGSWLWSDVFGYDIVDESSHAFCSSKV
ncbi:hypothetical protein QL285_009514 [Trifolium repens]|nr:hypothetical protein QL285_009514 [Trifolium repens]